MSTAGPSMMSLPRCFFLANYRAESFGQIHIPRRRQPERCGHGRGKIILVVENDAMFADLFAHAQRAVVHYQVRNAKARNARG